MIEADDKDWTWVLDRPCPECGYDAAEVAVDSIAARTRASAEPWPAILARPQVRARPDEATWSPLEYACHVRDVHRRFAERVGVTLAEDDPVFANWDQDATAVADRYGEQDPAVVAQEVVKAAAVTAALFETVTDWGRPARRSNGSAFTLATLGRYYLHDVLHHLHDVGAATG